jgi:excisionase family DNA binding protein
METQTAKYISTGELMKTLDVSRSTINRMVRRGMPHLWVGAVRRYPFDEVLQWLKQKYKGR